MRLQNNVILQFTISTLVVVLGISSVLGYFLTRRAETETIRVHLNIYPSLVRQEAEDHPEIYAFLASPPDSPLNTEIQSFFNNLLSLGSIFRVKVWGIDGTILWSDRKELIGKNFVDNEHFRVALLGGVSYQVAEPTKTEHFSEQEAGKILEIYTPIIRDGKIVGVIELYEQADELFSLIKHDKSYTWKLVSGGGTVLYMLLFSAFFGAYRREQSTMERLQRTLDAIIYTLAAQAEIRDIETGKHLDRTAAYVEIIALELRRSAAYESYLTDNYISDLVKATPLHDIGKVGVPDSILCKPGKLTQEEQGHMQRHAVDGATLLKEADRKLAFQSFLKIAIQISGSHHERWDGKGYPAGLSGSDIPLSARIMALADVYDALRSQRHYKKAFSHEESREIIIADRAKQFDPEVVDAFLRAERKFETVAARMADKPLHGVPERAAPVEI